MDLINKLEELALASRLKRLSDLLMKDMAEIYRETNAEFQPRWFTVFMALDRQDSLTITDIAKQLGISHTAVNKIVTDMNRHGLVEKKKDSADERRFRISLTGKGRNTRRDLDELWKGVRRANAELLTEAGVDLLGDIRKIENALDNRDMGNRMRQRVGLPERAQVEIVDYRPAYKKHFAALNYQWLEEDFAIEEFDRRMLEDPNGIILRRGGAIMFARHDEDIVGTCALLARPDGNVELVKMAVTPAFRGRGIGRLLTLHAIDRAKALGARRLVLATSPRLLVANVLYKSMGFRIIEEGPAEETEFERPSISMELTLDP
jgi:DNA-binding MarR family transcriptional regulator/predicted GNAT family acetyltransferase